MANTQRKKKTVKTPKEPTAQEDQNQILAQKVLDLEQSLKTMTNEMNKFKTLFFRASARYFAETG